MISAHGYRIRQVAEPGFDPRPFSPQAKLSLTELFSYCLKTLSTVRLFKKETFQKCLVPSMKGARDKGDFLIRKSNKLKQCITVDFLFHSLWEALG